MANATTLQLGAWNPLTDAFIPHPNAPTDMVYDLNDGVNWTLVDQAAGLGEGLSIAPPAPELYKASNSRVVGELITRRNYTKNRRIRATLLQLPQSSLGAWNANLRALIQLCEGITLTQPAALKIQLTSGAMPVYADVLEAHVSTRYKETLFAQSMNDEVVVEFECRPFLRGARQTLDNLVVNPGFEAPSGPGVGVFSDPFTNTTAYSNVYGTAPSVAANVMTVQANSRLTFGSPAWGAIAQWALRFQWQTSLLAYFYLHYVDGNNNLGVQINGTNLVLFQTVGGVSHTLSTQTAALTNGNWYWLLQSQFPSVAGVVCNVQAILYNDSAGALGTQVANTGSTTYTFDGVTALAGQMGLQANTVSMAVGGAFASVNQVLLFGPGGWENMTNNASGGGATGICSAAWDQNPANTYPNGPAASYGAARIDLPPAGTVSAAWLNFGFGGAGQSPTAAGASPIPVAAAGNTFGASCVVKSSGLSASATISFFAAEYNASGAYTGNFSTIALVTGNQANWVALSGAFTTHTGCAYLALQVRVDDMSVAGASAGGVVWLDNTQCWNQTTTGQQSMPYCALRFPQSPAQLLLSGIQGDVVAPASLSLGAFFSSLPAATVLSVRIGQLRTPQATFRGIFWPPQLGSASFISAGLNASAYGGFQETNNLNSSTAYTQQLVGYTYAPTGVSIPLAGMQGTFHLVGRIACSDTSGNLAQMLARVVAFDFLASATPWTAKYLDAYYGANQNAGLTTTNQPTIIDGGQVQLPPAAAGALTDLTQLVADLDLTIANVTSSTSTATSDWLALFPVDGAYLSAVINNPSNTSVTLTNQWLWVYIDGAQRQINQPPAWRYSIESGGLPAPQRGLGTPGTQSTGYININPGAGSLLELHPRNTVNGIAGVEQLVAQWDQGGAVLPLHAVIQYSPLYLWPF